jgi:hypothetical protein
MLNPMAMRKNRKAQFTVKSPSGINIKFSTSGRMEFGVTEGGFLRKMVLHGRQPHANPVLETTGAVVRLMK